MTKPNEEILQQRRAGPRLPEGGRGPDRIVPVPAPAPAGGTVYVRNGKNVTMPVDVELDGPEAVDRYLSQHAGPIKKPAAKGGRDA